MEFPILEKLWDLSNLIAGFAVIQAIAYLYSLGNPAFRPHIEKNWGIPFILIIVVHPIYIVAVAWCHALILSLSVSTCTTSIDLVYVNYMVGVGQGIVILALGVLAAVMTWNVRPQNIEGHTPS